MVLYNTQLVGILYSTQLVGRLGSDAWAATDSGTGITGGGPGKPPFWRTLDEFCKGLGSVDLKSKHSTHTGDSSSPVHSAAAVQRGYWVPLFTTWDPVAGSGRAPIPGNHDFGPDSEPLAYPGSILSWLSILSW